MTTQNKLVDLKPEDWLKIYVISEVNLLKLSLIISLKNKRLTMFVKLLQI